MCSRRVTKITPMRRLGESAAVAAAATGDDSGCIVIIMCASSRAGIFPAVYDCDFGVRK